MAFFNEFPHTRTYDSDLAWLIKRMKEVLARMDSVEARMQALEDLVENFIDTLNIDDVIADALRAMIADGTLLQILIDGIDTELPSFYDVKDLMSTGNTNTFTFSWSSAILEIVPSRYGRLIARGNMTAKGANYSATQPYVIFTIAKAGDQPHYGIPDVDIAQTNLMGYGYVYGVVNGATQIQATGSITQNVVNVSSSFGNDLGFKSFDITFPFMPKKMPT